MKGDIKKVLLLNLPGSRLYIRDYYCSKISKFGYVYHPVDILMLGGLLRASGLEVTVIDAIVDGLSSGRCIAMAKEAQPDLIIFLSGFVSWIEDQRFLKELKKEIPVPLCGAGDVFLGRSDSFYEKYPFIDAFAVDFSTRDIVHYLHGDYGSIQRMVFRNNGSLVIRWSSHRDRTYHIPLPIHDLLVSKPYRYPFVRHSQFATVLTDFGCPFQCSFCIMSKLGYKVRPIEEIQEEFGFLERLGIREIYFADQTFGFQKERIEILCATLSTSKRAFGWVCFFRVDLIDEATIGMMKDAGCHTIMLGIESAERKILESSRKGICLEQAMRAIELCKKAGLRVVGTFLLGLPEDDTESINSTISFALRSDFDYVSFNTVVPRPLTPLWEFARKQGITEEELEGMDQSGTSVVMDTRFIRKNEVKRLRDEAYRRFYYRGRYVLKRLLGVRTWYELDVHARGGLAILSGMLGK